jgi:stalled ribosome rescue protein Dom34
MIIMKKVTGIWIDKRIAKIVTLHNDSENFLEINSSIEEFHPKGGSGTRLKGGPQDVVQDSKYTEREKHQQKRFFKSIIDVIEDSDSIVIFGPAEMGKKLHSDISESNPTLYEKISEVAPADSMTDNQVKAWIRNYFDY